MMATKNGHLKTAKVSGTHRQTYTRTNGPLQVQFVAPHLEPGYLTENYQRNTLECLIEMKKLIPVLIPIFCPGSHFTKISLVILVCDHFHMMHNPIHTHTHRIVYDQQATSMLVQGLNVPSLLLYWQALIAKGADMEAKTRLKYTPLSFAAQSGHLSIVEVSQRVEYFSNIICSSHLIFLCWLKAFPWSCYIP